MNDQNLPKRLYGWGSEDDKSLRIDKYICDYQIQCHYQTDK